MQNFRNFPRRTQDPRFQGRRGKILVPQLKILPQENIGVPAKKI